MAGTQLPKTRIASGVVNGPIKKPMPHGKNTNPVAKGSTPSAD